MRVGADDVVRRAIDLVASVLGLVLSAPVMGVIAVCIKRDSRGPVVFSHERVGRHGRLFTLYKFRTMSSEPGSTGPAVTVSGDTRVTRVGARLRASKLDEIPQLFNVVKGDMSLVGPRPEVSEYVELWPAHQREVILSVRPGITDPMTLVLRREEELLGQRSDPARYYRQVLLPRKAAAYAEYVKQRSIIKDLELVLRTLKSVVRD